MGFAITYRTLEPVDAGTVFEIKRTAYRACGGRTWLSCEPVKFYLELDDGHLAGFSKPNFDPHPDDVATAASENLPDGTLSDLLDILCEVSRMHGVDWSFRHDHSDGPIGYIRNGVADADLRDQIEIFAELCGTLGEIDVDDVDDSSGIESLSDPEEDDDDDDGPRTLKFPGPSRGT